ncbi:MAG TPA: hypothetical protein VLJ21_02065 [Candidatus Binatia bacterium]|nr:hypothetical protein [Candidatus Binatia bacterium]
MALKDDAKKKVPARFRATREFAELLHLIDEKAFANSRALRMFLDTSIARCKANITRSSSSPTGQRHRRECAKHLELYTAIKKFLPYL